MVNNVTAALYRAPSQDQDELDSFSKNLEITLDKLELNNPFMLVVIGDLNAKSKNWHPSDRTTYEGNIIETITSHFGLHRLIHDPRHILGKSSSCIDLIFTSQPNMVVKSGVHSSLHANCHHQIVFAKFDLKIYYPPPNEREVWHYQEADSILIRRAIHEFNWKRALSNLNVDEQVTVFNRTILNIMKNFIPMKLLYAMTRIRQVSIKELSPLFRKVCYYLKHFKRTETTLK